MLSRKGDGKLGGFIQFLLTQLPPQAKKDRPYQPGEQMAATASNKSTAKKDLRYPEIEEQALCKSSISKYNNNL
ncbi:hypothetical protein HN873_063823 [Arachis hypogaea]